MPRASDSFTLTAEGNTSGRMSATNQQPFRGRLVVAGTVFLVGCNTKSFWVAERYSKERSIVMGQRGSHSPGNPDLDPRPVARLHLPTRRNTTSSPRRKKALLSFDVLEPE